MAQKTKEELDAEELVKKQAAAAKEQPKEEAVIMKLKPIEVRYRALLISLITSVATDGMKLSDARNELHSWIDDLSVRDASDLLQLISGVSNRVRDIAQSLSSETPSLIARLQH